MEQWKKAKHPMIVLGADLGAQGYEYIFGSLGALCQSQPNLFTETWNGISVLHRSAAKVGSLDIGFVPGPNASTEAPSVIYLLGADEIKPSDIPKNAFVIYQGHHGDVGAHLADAIFPASAYTEKNATFVNTEGRPQRTRAAVNPPGNSREDWQIIRALSEVLGFPLPYDNLRDIRQRVAQIAPHLADVDGVERTSPQLAKAGISQLAAAHKKATPGNTPFRTVISDYYLTNPISRASQTMAKCSAQFSKAKKNGEEVMNA